MYSDRYISQQSTRISVITAAAVLVGGVMTGTFSWEHVAFAVLMAIIAGYATAAALDWYRERNYYPVAQVASNEQEQDVPKDDTPAIESLSLIMPTRAPLRETPRPQSDNANGLSRAPRHYAAFVSAVANGKINKRHISNRALADALGISRFPENPEAQTLMAFLQENDMVQQRGQVWELVE